MRKQILHWLETFLTNRIENFAYLRTEIRKSIYFDTFEQRDDDIYIITYLKSGTTWMQMILYQMLTDGNMDFKHIYDVSPWITNEAHLGADAERVNKLNSPRIIKTHDPYENFDTNLIGKFIYVYRNGLDVSESLFHHNKNYNNPEITQKESFDNHFLPTKDYNWFNFTENWLLNKQNREILYIDYNNLKNDFKNTILKIADYLNVDITDEIYKRIEERSSFNYMKLHENKFGEQPKTNRVYDQFIRKGEIGEGEKIDEIQKNVFNTLYEKKLKKLVEKLNL